MARLFALVWIFNWFSLVRIKVESLCLIMKVRRGFRCSSCGSLQVATPIKYIIFTVYNQTWEKVGLKVGDLSSEHRAAFQWSSCSLWTVKAVWPSLVRF